jgi:hypothetical protein
VETPIIVAVATGGFALVVGVIQLLNQNRQNARVEKLRADLNRGNSLQLEYFKTLMSFQVEGRSKRLQSIGNMIEVSQTIKDKVKLVADHPRSFPDRELLNKELTSLQDKVSQIFAANQISIDDKAWEIAHSLKNQCIAGLQLILDPDGTSTVGFNPLTEKVQLISTLQNELRVIGRESIDEISSAIIKDIAAENDRSKSGSLTIEN